MKFLVFGNPIIERDNLALKLLPKLKKEFPEIEFVRPCNHCPHMKRITLPKILDSLQNLKYVVDVDPRVAERAQLAVRRMLDPAPQPLGKNAQ